ncbi:MAG: hypothetical protein ACRC7N_02390 [Clostridium sp.]
MKICTECNSELIFGSTIKTEWDNREIKLVKKEYGSFSKKKDIKVGICPNCGEIKLFINNSISKKV